jgi:hypothetical protein
MCGGQNQWCVFTVFESKELGSQVSLVSSGMSPILTSGATESRRLLLRQSSSDEIVDSDNRDAPVYVVISSAGQAEDNVRTN